MDTDPKKPKYIAAAGPREATIADFWQVSSCCIVSVAVRVSISTTGCELWCMEVALEFPFSTSS